jgi:uncharacterized protein YcfL
MFLKRLSTILFLTIFLLLSCSASDKKEAATSAQNAQVAQIEVQQTQPEEPFKRIRDDPNYEEIEKSIRMQINLHYAYFYYTPEGKAEPLVRREESLEKLLSLVKSRYSLTDQQVNTIRNNQLYIGMHRTCVYLAWGIYRDSLGLSPDEVKNVSTNGVNHKIVFEVYPGKYRTAFTENDVLVSYQE